MNFNKDTLIGEILEVAPDKADILLEMGMHCLSCPASQQESLEEACEVHGIDVEEVLEKLNSQNFYCLSIFGQRAIFLLKIDKLFSSIEITWSM